MKLKINRIKEIIDFGFKKNKKGVARFLEVIKKKKRREGAMCRARKKKMRHEEG